MLIFDIFHALFTWNSSLILMNFEIMILRKISFDIIWYSVIFAAILYCQYSYDHLICWTWFYECCHSCLCVRCMVCIYVVCFSGTNISTYNELFNIICNKIAHTPNFQAKNQKDICIYYLTYYFFIRIIKIGNCNKINDN